MIRKVWIFFLRKCFWNLWNSIFKVKVYRSKVNEAAAHVLNKCTYVYSQKNLMVYVADILRVFLMLQVWSKPAALPTGSFANRLCKKPVLWKTMPWYSSPIGCGIPGSDFHLEPAITSKWALGVVIFRLPWKLVCIFHGKASQKITN